MPRSLQYILLFAITALVQLLLLDNLSISIFVHPMLYVAFVLLLPVELASGWVLVAGLVMGLAMDFGSGSAALNTASLLAVAFTRPVLLRLELGREELREGGGTPTAAMMGRGKFLRYALLGSLLHCAIYFTLEATTWSYFYLTAVRIVVGMLLTAGAVWVCQLFFRGR